MAEPAVKLEKKTIRDIPLRGVTCLVRVDFNVPLEGGRAVDYSRIVAALPTIKYLIEQNARVILCSHLGRPRGKRVPALSLRPVALALQQLLGRPVAFCPEAVGPRARRAAEALTPGGVLLLENLRFYPEEQRNAPEFARALAGLAEVFVNDAFGAAHRAHASTVGVAEYLPAVAGLLIEREIAALSRLLTPERPFAAIVGGAKVSDKLAVVRSLVNRVDRLMIGGGMANTFLFALGYKIGKSLFEADQLAEAEHVIAASRECGVELYLPIDVVVAETFAADAARKTVPVDAVPDEWMILDLGPLTVEHFAAGFKDTRTVFWNGPLGVCEWSDFAQGTEGVARALAQTHAYRVVGGGDSIAALSRLGLTDRVDHISTGGGASLEFVEGRVLPGIAALQDR